VFFHGNRQKVCAVHLLILLMTVKTLQQENWLLFFLLTESLHKQLLRSDRNDQCDCGHLGTQSEAAILT